MKLLQIYQLGICVTLLSSAGCSGVRTLKSVTLHEREFGVQVTVPGSAHNITFSLEDKLEGSAIGWVTNRGKESIGVYYLEFSKLSADSRVRAPTTTTKLLLRPGEKKEVFRGPADLLMCKFYSMDPGGAKIFFDVLLGQPPRHPVSGKLEYSFGGP